MASIFAGSMRVNSGLNGLSWWLASGSARSAQVCGCTLRKASASATVERELAEAEALLAARERLIRSAKTPPPATIASPEHVEALRRLQEELDRQENSLREQRATLKEREDFLDQSEALLASKMQQQQEKETELEQMEDDLRRKLRQLGLLKAEPPPEIEHA